MDNTTEPEPALTFEGATTDAAMEHAIAAAKRSRQAHNRLLEKLAMRVLTAKFSREFFTILEDLDIESR